MLNGAFFSIDIFLDWNTYRCVITSSIRVVRLRTCYLIIGASDRTNTRTPFTIIGSSSRNANIILRTSIFILSTWTQNFIFIACWWADKGALNPINCRGALRKYKLNSLFIDDIDLKVLKSIHFYASSLKYPPYKDIPQVYKFHLACNHT